MQKVMTGIAMPTMKIKIIVAPPKRACKYSVWIYVDLKMKEYDESWLCDRPPQVLLNYVRNFKDLVVFKLKKQISPYFFF